MARYIDADKLATRVRGNNSQRTMWREIKGMVDNAPTADVVPRSELERVNVELDAMRGVANSYKLHYENAKKEIGEEIYRIIGECHNETWICLLIKEFADRLTKKDESQN